MIYNVVAVIPHHMVSPFNIQSYFMYVCECMCIASVFRRIGQLLKLKSILFLHTFPSASNGWPIIISGYGIVRRTRVHGNTSGTDRIQSGTI